MKVYIYAYVISLFFACTSLKNCDCSVQLSLNAYSKSEKLSGAAYGIMEAIYIFSFRISNKEKLGVILNEKNGE